ncbi:hypothetical protein FD723_40065 (plasmid) [Nostoc sp. C052]|uniref:hypothetical protein n=1 Tax=Nostoc sp. C052 TaxID=2576902 RepID=UPI0015C33043|nr:hypothetical protein [Nostoc sp. C052]QLE46410.1 hypothetical protein FD723_40065 [Nostoc sp. C052]
MKEPDSNDAEYIRLVSSVSPGSWQPTVLQSYGENTITMSAEVARKRAIAVLQAIAYADSESTIFKSLANVGHGGFGKPPQKNLKMACQLVQIMRENRQALPEGIDAFFGDQTQQATVALRWDGIEILLSLDEAYHHATSLLEVAESAESDAFFYKFLSSDLGLEPQVVQNLLNQFCSQRERTRLEAIAKQ